MRILNLADNQLTIKSDNRVYIIPENYISEEISLTKNLYVHLKNAMRSYPGEIKFKFTEEEHDVHGEFIFNIKKDYLLLDSEVKQIHPDGVFYTEEEDPTSETEPKAKIKKPVNFEALMQGENKHRSQGGGVFEIKIEEGAHSEGSEAGGGADAAQLAEANKQIKKLQTELTAAQEELAKYKAVLTEEVLGKIAGIVELTDKIKNEDWASKIARIPADAHAVSGDRSAGPAADLGLDRL